MLDRRRRRCGRQSRCEWLESSWLGLALRIWAIAALGGAFRTTVEVEPGQTVVSTGPYRWIRHPSYAGLLLIVAGFGAALGNYRVLGEAYRTYQSDRARLIPRLW